MQYLLTEEEYKDIVGNLQEKIDILEKENKANKELLDVFLRKSRSTEVSEMVDQMSFGVPMMILYVTYNLEDLPTDAQDYFKRKARHG